MIFGTQISWFFNEIISVILFFACVAHIFRHDHSFERFMELICYMLTAGIFENIGVWQNIYYYSTNRIMMFGRVPVAILLIEGSIFYCAFLLAQRLRLPTWAIPLTTGLLCSIQDMTLDPASVYDIYNINGTLEGQWNWTKGYSGGFVDIPFANFSGWLTMMMFFSAAILLGRWLYEKKRKNWLRVVYPWMALLITLIMLISPVNQFLLYGMPFVEMNTKNAELTLLIFSYVICMVITLRFGKHVAPTLKKGDGLVVFIPVLLHLYALVICVTMGITAAFPAVIIVAVLHIAYLLFVP